MYPDGNNINQMETENDMADTTMTKSYSLTPEAVRMLEVMTSEDNRSASNFVDTLVREEYARRYSAPNIGITLEQAIEAGGGEA